MVPLIFSILSFLACVFLIYVLAQFHRELARGKGWRGPRARAVVVVMPSRPCADEIGVRDKRAS
jgi:hypothetical protein